MNATKVPPKRTEDKGSGSDEEDVDPRFRFDGTPAATEPVEHGPKLPARNKLSSGQMASNYGVGYSMLKKMGFQGGGLGAKEDGIANPIEVIKRKGRQGLQDEGEMLDQDLYGRDAVGSRVSVEELLAPKGKKGKEAAQRPGESWKREEREKRPRTVYKTAAEVASEPSHMRIVDMRGPEVRVVSSFSELAASIGGDTVKSLKELRHNARLLVARYEDRIRAAAESKRHCEDVLLSVAKERERLEAAGSLESRDVFYCRQLAREVEGLRERQDEGSVSLKELASAFDDLLREHPKEFKAMRLLDVALALALPTARRELVGWKPLEKPERGLELVASWRELLEGQDPQSFGALCEQALLPSLRAALCEWPVQDCEPCLQLLERCRKRLPPATVEAIMVQVLLPRLRAEVDAWDPRVDRVPVHLWIHPWLPVLGSRLDCLWAPLRFKLSKCLERWEPGDRSALEVLKPWKLVLDPSNWEPLIEKVLSRLKRAIAEMEVRPDGQDVEPMKDLFAWAGVAPASGIARVMEVAFFPPWLAALNTWLRSSGCDYGEVLQWYQGWKSMLPEELREEPSVQRHFGHGLQVMRHFMAQGGAAATTAPPEAPPSSAPDSDRRPAGQPPRAAPAVGVAPEDVSLSLADYLADVAAEQGLVFRPKAEVRHQGKQVYQLGAINVYLSRNLVHAAPKGGQEGEWSVVSVDEAMKLARGPTGNGNARR